MPVEKSTKPRPALPYLTFLGFQLNGWAEDKKQDLTFQDVQTGLDDGTLWEILETKIPGMDISMYRHKDEPITRIGVDVLGALQDAEAGMRDRERRKYGVEASGLHLLLAYLIEAVQQHYWVKGHSR
jgi:hypothetical protein